LGSRRTGGTEALNDVGRLYTDLGDGMSADSKSELWRRFVHAVSYEEIATVLGCLDG
jgi:DNA-directed RNA polymerase specialized sigma24 family protein